MAAILAAALQAAGGGGRGVKCLQVLVVSLLPLLWLQPADSSTDPDAKSWSQTGPRLQLSHSGRRHINSHCSPTHVVSEITGFVLHLNSSINHECPSSQLSGKHTRIQNELCLYDQFWSLSCRVIQAVCSQLCDFLFGLWQIFTAAQTEKQPRNEWELEAELVCLPCVFYFDYYHMETSLSCFYFLFCACWFGASCNTATKAQSKLGEVPDESEVLDYFPAVWFQEGLDPVLGFQWFSQRAYCCQSWKELYNM